MYIYIEMPDCTAFGQSGTGMNRTNDARTVVSKWYQVTTRVLDLTLIITNADVKCLKVHMHEIFIVCF
jgi:hypothetical protein